MTFKAMYLYRLRIYDISTALNQLKAANIKIYQLRKIDDFTYTFFASVYTKHRLKNEFPGIEIVRRAGFLSVFVSLIHYKTTLIAFVLSIALYFICSSRIWKVSITGDSILLYDLVAEELQNHDIKVGNKVMDIDTLSVIQSKILYENYDRIEYLSIQKKGCVIEVSFRKKREKVDQSVRGGNLYASRDGIIKSFDLLSGEKVVQINDYVKKGDLLVKDIVTSDYNEEIYVGTYGSVYAYTWYYADVETTIPDGDYDETETFSFLLMEARHQIAKNFAKDEYIYEENVLQFTRNGNHVTMRVHFTCVEDISKEG